MQAAPSPAAPGGKAIETLGAFQLEGHADSRLRQIKYRGQTYRPLNAYEFIHVRAPGPTIGGQPVLLAVSNDFMGVGTILIAVQNDTPLARVLSPTVDTRDPESVSPDNRSGALLLDNEIRLSAAGYFHIAYRYLLGMRGAPILFSHTTDRGST